MATPLANSPKNRFPGLRTYEAMRTLLYLGCFVGAAVMTFGLTPLVLRLATRAGVVDLPGGRRVHATPIPRLGGLAVFLGLMAAVGSYIIVSDVEVVERVTAARDFPALILACFLVFGIGLVDDVKDLSPSTRILVEAAAATVLMTSGYLIDSIWHPFGPPLPLGVLAYPVTLMWFIGVTNAFNLIDGLDGLLSSVAIASLVGIMLVGSSIFMTGTPIFALTLAGGLLGFLPWNWHKARIFMGDSGSLLVGFLVAALALKVSRYHVEAGGVALHVMVALCAMPIAETSLTVARRYVSGARLFSGDKSHTHHVLIRRKRLSVPMAVLALTCVQILFSAIAVASRIRLGWYSLIPVGLLLVFVLLAVRWLNYVEFAVLARYLLGGLVRQRRRSLTNIFSLANAGTTLGGVESAQDLSDSLERLVHSGYFIFIGIELRGEHMGIIADTVVPCQARNREAGEYLVGRGDHPCWLISREVDDAERRASRGNMRYALPLVSDGVTYGEIVCDRLYDPGSTEETTARDVYHYLALPLADVMARLSARSSPAEPGLGQTKVVGSPPA